MSPILNIEAQPATPLGFRDVTDLNGYLGLYGNLLGRKAIDALDPLYIPGESTSLDMTMFGRKPFPAQANVINAAALAWRNTKSLIICGEMGTGKTLLGAAAIHAAIQARKPGEPYRALIMAPNHLIDKWEREIMSTIPGATVRTFEKSDPSKGDDSYKQVLQYIASCKGSTPSKWAKSTGPEWVIVGRNQAKWDPAWHSLVEREHAHSPGVVLQIPVTKEERRDKDGMVIFKDGKKTYTYITQEGVRCPSCGNAARDKGGLLLSPEDLAASKNPVFCKGRVLQEIHTAERKPGAFDRMSPIPKKYADLVGSAGRKPGSHEPARTLTIEGRTYEIRECGEPLWEWMASPRKWAPAKIIQKKGKGLFDYFILDEMHEEKAAGSAQALAAGKLMASSRRLIGLTGTLIGGYANHLFPLLMRMAPTSLVDEGFEWGGEMAFAKAYGRVDKIITTKYGEEKRSTGKRRNSTSMAKGDGTSTCREEVKPGVMPTFFGRHLLDKAIFIGLDEMYDDLPELIDDDRSLIQVEMDDDLAAEYKRVQDTLVSVNNSLIQKGCMKLMSTLLHTLMGYPDKPFGWEPPAGCDDKYAVGYYLDSNDKKPANYVGVVSPDNFDDRRVYAKEQALLDLIAREAAEGRQCWVYCEMTGKRDVQSRLAKLIKDRGYSVKVLRSTTCEPRDREAWIAKEGPGVHVMISNPDLVSTGLDFFDKAGTFNFSTIIFYQQSYDINATRQAGHRHWRIGQPLECRTYYLYYRGTMQHRAVKHCGDKLAAAKSLEGKFSAEGLAALASGGLAMTEMARTLSNQIDDPRAAWAKLRGAAKAKVVKLVQSGAIVNLLSVAAEHDHIAHEARMLAEQIALEPIDFDMLDDDELDEVIDLDDDALTAFHRAMAELGISLDQL